MAIQLAESQQGANHLQINTAHTGVNIADAFEDRRTDRRILQPLIVHHKTLDQVFLKPIEYWAVENIWIDSITRGWRTSGGILAEDHRSRTCPGPLAAPTGFEVQPPHRRRRSSAPRLLHGGGAHYSYFLEFLHPQISFFRLIHAAYYHESIIVHIKPIFYNDIWAELTLPRSHKTRIIN